MTKISLKFKRLFSAAESFLLSRAASKSRIIKKHKTVIEKQLTRPVFFCKILKSLSRQDIWKVAKKAGIMRHRFFQILVSLLL